MDFYTKCYIPTLKKEIRINSIKFGDFVKINNYIQNRDYESINQIFNEICENTNKFPVKIKNLDKFYILLHLKNFFFDPSLRLSGKNDEESVIFDVLLTDIMKKCLNYDFKNFELPEHLYYKNVEDILKENGQNIEEIKKHINSNKILMFDMPDFIKGIPKVYINCFDNTLFYFCKTLYSSNLSNIYNKIIALKKKFNFSLDEIYNMNPKELDLFLKTK
jgi:hypothetical protein